jgi:hypothetical protein
VAACGAHAARRVRGGVGEVEAGVRNERFVWRRCRAALAEH